MSEAQANLRELEKRYDAYVTYYRNADPKNGRYLFIGSQAKLDEMAQNELLRFVKVFGVVEKLSIEEMKSDAYTLASYDVIIYRSNVDDKGEDETLKGLVLQLNKLPEMPLVVYSKERILGKTESEMNNHQLLHIANNQISLIDNVASAYRISKLIS